MAYLDHDFNEYPELTNAQLEQLQFLSPFTQITQDFSAVVVKVVDGDTIRVRTDFRDFDFPIRFLEIDSPEMNEPGGKEAKEWLKTQIEGENVEVLIDKSNRVDKYGRLLGKIMHKGIDVADVEMQLGYAFKFGDKHKHIVPNFDSIVRIEQWL